MHPPPLHYSSEATWLTCCEHPLIDSDHSDRESEQRRTRPTRRGVGRTKFIYTKLMERAARIVRNLGLSVAAVGTFLEFSLYDGKLLHSFFCLISRRLHFSGFVDCPLTLKNSSFIALFLKLLLQSYVIIFHAVLIIFLLCWVSFTLFVIDCPVLYNL